MVRLSWNDEVVITNTRHKVLLGTGIGGFARVDFSIDLMSAYEALGAILGEEVGEDLVDEIFDRFCMGK